MTDRELLERVSVLLDDLQLRGLRTREWIKIDGMGSVRWFPAFVTSIQYVHGLVCITPRDPDARRRTLAHDPELDRRDLVRLEVYAIGGDPVLVTAGARCLSVLADLGIPDCFDGWANLPFSALG